MTKTLKRMMFLLMAVICATCFVPLSCAAADDDFTTKEYDVMINVKEDNSAYVSEKIDVKIDKSLEYIERIIPLSLTQQYHDAAGTEIKLPLSPLVVEDVSVASTPFETEKKRGKMIVKLGDGKEKLKGSQTFNIQYMVRNYDDGTDEYDSFYMNVLPSDWASDIEKATIQIVMPNSFDKKNMEVIVGEYGKKDYSHKVKTSVKGNTITITTKETLPKGVGISVGAKLQEGYFDGVKSYTFTNILLYITAIVLIAGMLLLWHKFGRDPKAAKVVEYYPPEGVTPAEIGYITDEKVDKEDIISMLMYFAQRGYLAIEQAGRDDYILHRMGDLPRSAKEYERELFDGIFSGTSVVKLSDIAPHLPGIYQKTKQKLESEYRSGARKIFPGALTLRRIAVALLAALGMGIGIVVVWRIHGNISMLLLGVLSIILMLAGLFLAVTLDKGSGVHEGKANGKEGFKGKMHKGAKGIYDAFENDEQMYTRNGILLFVKSSRVGRAIFSLIITAASMALSGWLMMHIFGNIILCVLFALLPGVGYFCVRFMKGRTKFGRETLEGILEFKEFMRVADESALEDLENEDPQYFFKTMAFAYVMGMSKTWAKKFRSVELAPPSWYVGEWKAGRFSSENFDAMWNDFSACVSAHI